MSRRFEKSSPMGGHSGRPTDHPRMPEPTSEVSAGHGSLQQQSGAEYATLSARIAQHPPSEFALSVVSFHEQVLGCHTYLSRARDTSDLLHGYRMLDRLLRDFATSAVATFDAAAGAAFDGL